MYMTLLFYYVFLKCTCAVQVFTALWDHLCLSFVMQAFTVIRLAFGHLLVFVLLVSTALKAPQILMLRPVLLDITVPEAQFYLCPAYQAH